jgi:hypothetical protein
MIWRSFCGTLLVCERPKFLFYLLAIRRRKYYESLAIKLIVRNTGVMTSLLQEIISVYPLLMPSSLTAAASNRVCNALALLQCVASHNDTRGLFLHGAFFYLFFFISFFTFYLSFAIR